MLADVSGYRPRLGRCASCRTPLDVGAGALWDDAAGGLCCPACRTRESARLSQEQIAWMCGVLCGGLTPQKTPARGRCSTFCAGMWKAVWKRRGGLGGSGFERAFVVGCPVEGGLGIASHGVMIAIFHRAVEQAHALPGNMIAPVVAQLGRAFLQHRA